jgi:hypothetical protein
MEAETKTGREIDHVILKASNNLDGKDNLDQLPQEPAVYGIFGRINGTPTNCRFVGQCDNLQKEIKKHFSDEEADSCLKTFMQSIKIKTINYQLMQASSEADRLNEMKKWKSEYDPKCNEELNKVY